MKIADIDILIIPGLSNSGPDHWQSRWERKIRNARRVEQADWETPMIGDWVGNIVQAVARASRPVILVAHSLGVSATAHAATKLPAGIVAGALLVAAPDLTQSNIWPARHGGFDPVPLGQLPFRSCLVASTNDPYCALERAREFATAWGSAFIEAGEVGHVNSDSGHGPWPEGLMRLGWFLKQLETAG